METISHPSQVSEVMQVSPLDAKRQSGAPQSVNLFPRGYFTFTFTRQTPQTSDYAVAW
jgi:hypothetical protein